MLTIRFAANPIEELGTAYYYVLRFNLTTFSTLLKLFKDDLRTTLANADDVDSIDLAGKVGHVMARVLPSLRVYSSWLLVHSHYVAMLAHEKFLIHPIDLFWDMYATTLDEVTAAFPIWDLEDVPEVTYMLDEDVQTLGMLPLVDDEHKTAKVWTVKATGSPKPKFSELGVERVSLEDENLARIKDFLVDGLYLANDNEEAPIGLKGTRIYHGEPPEDPAPFVPTAKGAHRKTGSVNSQSTGPKKPLSYAAAATLKGVASGAPPSRGTAPRAPRQPIRRDASQLEDMNRMVNQLVGDEDDGDDPVTPPQQYTVTPAIANQNGNAYGGTRTNAQDVAKMPPPTSFGFQAQVPTNATTASSATPNSRMPKQGSSPWMGSPFGISPNFPSDIPQGTITPQPVRQGHSRVGSATSTRSRTSQGDSPMFSSVEAPTQQQRRAPGAGPLVNGYSFNTPVASPLLFGASNTMWSNARGGFGGKLRRSFGETTGSPPNGQGG